MGKKTLEINFKNHKMIIWLLLDKIKNIWLRGKTQWRSYQCKLYKTTNKGQININERENTKI